MLLVLIVVNLLACNLQKKEGDNEMESVTANDMNDDQKKIVTVEEEKIEVKKEQLVDSETFMEYFGIEESEIPKEYVVDFVTEFGLTEEDIKDSNFGEQIIKQYNNGKVYGKDLGVLFRGENSSLSLDEYMQEADLIYIDFEMRGDSDISFEKQFILDIKNQKAYFSELSVSDYIDAEKSAALSDTEVQNIRQEFSKHIEENKGVGDYGISGEYSFIIKMKAEDYSVKMYDGDSGDEEHFPGFDSYWKELYNEIFGEEYDKN